MVRETLDLVEASVGVTWAIAGPDSVVRLMAHLARADSVDPFEVVQLAVVPDPGNPLPGDSVNSAWPGRLVQRTGNSWLAGLEFATSSTLGVPDTCTQGRCLTGHIPDRDAGAHCRELVGDLVVVTHYVNLLSGRISTTTVPNFDQTGCPSSVVPQR